MNLETLKDQWEVPGFLISMALGGAGSLLQNVWLLGFAWLIMTVLYVLILMEE